MRPDVPNGGELAWLSVRALCSQGRADNQDNLVVVDSSGVVAILQDEVLVQGIHRDWPEGRLRLSVLDGMGGHAKGRQIAERAAELISRLPARSSHAELCQDLDTVHTKIWHEMCAASRVPCPGTTLTLLEVPRFQQGKSEGWLFHVGDSRLYEITPKGEAHCLTVDHVPATTRALLGVLDETEWYEAVHMEPHSVLS